MVTRGSLLTCQFSSIYLFRMPFVVWGQPNHGLQNYATAWPTFEGRSICFNTNVIKSTQRWLQTICFICDNIHMLHIMCGNFMTIVVCTRELVRFKDTLWGAGGASITTSTSELTFVCRTHCISLTNIIVLAYRTRMSACLPG
jgi:hypothetical protein